MTIEKKLVRLGQNAMFDLSCACGMEPARRHGPDGRWVYPAVMPDGSQVRMLKVLMDNACQNDCIYCAQRAGRDTPRDRFTPEELSCLFDEMVRAGHVQALFLSSGLGGNSVRTMDRMIAAVEIIRRRYQFHGFVHLKILPAVEYSQVERAAQLAQRISINIEAPGAGRMAVLSAGKNFAADILTRMRWISDLVLDRKTRARGHTTQFVVGAAGESDREIVSAADKLYGRYNLSRAYYSGFQPVPQTPLEHLPAAGFVREHRLYQTDFLLRKYGFSFSEIPFEADGNLSCDTDPKTAWAGAHPDFFPLEVNKAEPERLLRVPGLGPISVKRIVKARMKGKLRWPEDIAHLGALASRSAPYLLFEGKKRARQMELFDTRSQST
jgi:predicted DNA-binding helix-hairpin-helix protein